MPLALRVVPVRTVLANKYLGSAHHLRLVQYFLDLPTLTKSGSNSQLGGAPTYLPGQDLGPLSSGPTYLPPKLTKPDVSSGPTYLTPNSPNRTLHLFI